MNQLPPTLLTTNTSTPAEAWSGKGTLFAWASFDAGTVKLQYSPDGGLNWLDAVDDTGTVVSLSAAGAINFDLGNCLVRGTLSGATAPSVSIAIQPRR